MKITPGILMASAILICGCTVKDRNETFEGATVPSSSLARKKADTLPGFGDAVGAIVGRLVAAHDAQLPGNVGGAPCAAIHRWTAETAGSVRIVGSIRKLSPGTEAEFHVLVDGKEIWQRKLETGDLLRHGVDIVAYDLADGGAVDLVVTTEAEPVQIAVALQFVPEPFVSRWRPGLPTGYPTWTEKKRVALRKKGQDILQQIREASTAGRKRIVIPPGHYLFHANWSRASTLKDLADLEIVAEGVTFWFEPPMIHALLFDNCRNVTVRGLTIDFTMPVWFQARVSEIDREGEPLQADLMEGYSPRDAKGETQTRGNRAFMFYDANGRFINHRHTPADWQLSRDGRSVTCREFRRNKVPDALEPGGYIVGTIRTGAALRSENCARMRFEDINIWSSPGVAVREGGGDGGHVYLRVRATRRPHTNRLHAFGADVFHMAATDRGPTLDRCESAYSADDNLNIHGSFGRVVKRVDDRRYYLQGAYEAGDVLEFRDMKSVKLLGSAKAISAERTPGGPALAINDKYKAKGEFFVELNSPLVLPELSLVVMDGKRSSAGWSVRNCWFHSNFQRTLINGSPGGLIENTTLQNVGMGICIQFETWGPWMEGPFARDLVIRNNRFLDAPPAGPAVNVSMHPPGGGSNRRRFEAKPVTNMTIAGNCFGRTSGIPLSIHNVDGLTIHGNSIDRPADTALPDQTKWFHLQDCSNVSFEDN
ncbi:MAG: right-handed parallel beta-helix repeat-containing protein [Lentisphaerae bacterium]|nr:right-handed parallel beta-helix repeat-containing protein [Lentisphaerota bacterium]